MTGPIRFRVVARVIVNGEVLSEETYTTDGVDSAAIRAMSERHLATLNTHGGRGMVEFEFPDAPDENQRFFRIGTDPAMMRNPIALDFTKRQIH